MKKIWSSIILLMLLCTITVATVMADEPVLEGEYIEGEVLAKASGDFLSNIARTRTVVPFELEPVFTAPSDNQPVANTRMASNTSDDWQVVLAKSDSMSTEQMIEALEEYPDVEYAEPNYIVYTSSVNDIYFDEQWYMHDSQDIAGANNVEAVWETGTTGTDAVVAVVDTGVDYTHPDLANNMWRDENGFCGYDFFNDDSDPMDDDSHGTHVAGILGAQGNNLIGISGVNQSVKIMALKVLDEQGQGDIYAILSAYQYIANKKEEGVNILAVNSSWNAPAFSRLEQDVFDAVGEMGIITVMSSGNDAADYDNIAEMPYSSSVTTKLTVNASDDEGKAADYSNFGLRETDLYAPGNDILSTGPVDLSWYDPTDKMISQGGTVLWQDEDHTWDRVTTVKEVTDEDTAYVHIQDPDSEFTSYGTTALQWDIYSEEENDLLGIEWNLGDLSAHKESAKALGGCISVIDNSGEMLARMLTVSIKGINDTWITWNPDDEDSSFMANYDTPYPAYIDLQNQKENIDWSDFTVRIFRRTVAYDQGLTLSFSLERLVLLNDPFYYFYSDGTSMATPVVTGAVALLANHYGVDQMLDGEEKTNALKEIRARIVGGVHRTQELANKCQSGGYLDLEKAITNPYPVLDSLEQKGNEATISGYFFEDSMGTLTMGNHTVEVVSWSDREITFKLPDGTKDDLYEFCVLAASDSNQNGRNRFLVEAIDEDEVSAYFEKLIAPDTIQLGLATDLAETTDFSIAYYDNHIYATNGSFCRQVGDQLYLAIFCYNMDTQTWMNVSVNIPMNQVGNEVNLSVIDHTMYITQTSSEISVHSYDLQTEEVQLRLMEPVDSNGNVLGYSGFAYDSENIWIAGGLSVDESTSNAEISPAVFRYSIQENKLERLQDLNYPRQSPCVEIVGDNLYVIGGENLDHEWETHVEALNLNDGSSSNLDLSMYPNVYNNQQLRAASGVFDSSIIISGIYSDEKHTSDTMIYNTETNSWTAASKKLMETKVFYSDGVVEGDYFYVLGESNYDTNVQNVFLRLKVKDTPEPTETAADTPTASPEETPTETGTATDAPTGTITAIPTGTSTDKGTGAGSSTVKPTNTKGNTAARTGDEAMPRLMLVIVALSGMVAACIVCIKLVRKKKS